MLPLLFTAFGLGLLGSFHCVGMCGPLALSLPLPNTKGTFFTELKILSIVLYNLGRAICYALLGVVFSFIGEQFFVGSMQQTLSIVLGILFILSVLAPKLFKHQSALYQKYYAGVLKAISRFVNRKGLVHFLAIGFLNGLLPCGLVYIALASAVATNHAYSAAAFMFAFALGTMPLMIAVALLGNFIGLNVRNKIRKTVPVMIGLMGVLLILRGLDLGIPYISPSINHHAAVNTANCHG